MHNLLVEIYIHFIQKLEQQFELSGEYLHRYIIDIQLKELVLQVLKFTHFDQSWCDAEKISDFYRSNIFPTNSLKIKISNKDKITMFKEIWGLNEEIILNEKFHQLPLVCFKTGRFVKNLFDYHFEIDLGGEDKEELIFKKLYLMLPNNEEKLVRFNAIFGTTEFKYKKVILDLINDYFSNTLLELKTNSNAAFLQMGETTALYIKNKNIFKAKHH